MTKVLSHSADRNAAVTTQKMVADLENSICGDPTLAVIYCNSAIAAVEILLSRYGVASEIYRPLYDDHWRPAVEMELWTSCMRAN